MNSLSRGVFSLRALYLLCVLFRSGVSPFQETMGLQRLGSCWLGRDPSGPYEKVVLFSTTKKRRIDIFKQQEAYSFNYKIELILPQCFLTGICEILGEALSFST